MPAARKMRLLIVSQPPIAGVPRHVLDVVEFLDPERWDITVVCPRGGWLWNGLEAFPHVRRVPMAAARAPSPSDLLTVVRLVRLAREADVIHAHSSKAGFVGRLAAALTGRRRQTVFTPHAWSYWAFAGWQRVLYTALERLAARWGQVIVALSRFERDDALELGIGSKDQYRVVPNGIEVERFGADRHPDLDLMVMVARLADQKDPLLAVRVLAEVRRTVPRARLRLIGDGPLREAVANLAGELGVTEGIELVGERLDVPEHLAVAGCLLHTARYEGCPLTVLEAMAAGVPVVAAQSGGIDEIVEDGVTGHVCSRDPAELARAAASILLDPGHALALGESARAHAREWFPRERMARETERIYLELLHGPDIPGARR